MDRRSFLEASLRTGLAFGVFSYLQGCSNRDGSPQRVEPSVQKLVPIADVVITAHFGKHDRQGNYYRIDGIGHSIVRATSTGDPLWKSGSLGTELGAFNMPTDMHPHEDGFLYIVDSGNSRIVVLDDEGKHRYAFGGRGTGYGSLNIPRSMVALNDELFVCDGINHRIHTFNSGGNPLRVIGSFGTGLDQLNLPVGLAFDSDGNLHVVDKGNARIQVYDSQSGNWLGSYGLRGTDVGQFSAPNDIVIDKNDFAYVTDAATRSLNIFNGRGELVERRKPFLAGGDEVVPWGLHISPDNTLLITAGI